VTGPDLLVPVLDGRAGNRPWRMVHLGEAPVPTLTDRVRGVLVLGGPMGVADGDEHPWIADELVLLRAAVDGGIPVFGICLGAQLLATAMGGTVMRREVPEVGIFALDRTAAAQQDPVFAGWSDGAHVLLSHQDQVDTLPDGAEAMLTGSDGVPAWRTADGRGYGVQFHPETGPELFAAWAQHPDLRQLYANAGVDADELVADVRRRAAFLRAAGLSLVGRWLDGVVGADDPTPRKRSRQRA
jgi:GMP synthase (glutamine-hydrolysing)